MSGEDRHQAFDPGQAHQARMYDYMLGGRDNYAADRAAAAEWVKADPSTPFTVRANRAFLGRAIRYLAAEGGIRQFLDIGAGIPTAGNTHQVAQEIAPDSRVVYVDYDPVVVAHGRALLTSSEAGAIEYVDSDLRDPGAILDQAGRLLDFTRPVAITLVAILHAIPGSDDPHGIVSALLDAVPSGSYLALSHLGSDLVAHGARDEMEGISRRSMRQRISARGREEVARFFDGTDLVDPGVVRLEQWRPDATAPAGQESFLWCALGRKR